jgi:C_GCAxxG_C_C family probable redox protein
METENSAIPDIAIAFAGGIGNTGSVCGAVVGAVMAIGLKLGRADTMEGYLHNLSVAGEFRRRFEAEMKSINCREMTGIDLSTKEGVEQFMDSDTPQTICFPAVGTAYRLVLDLLKETSMKNVRTV